MTFPRPQSVREARPDRQKTLLHVQGGGAPADTKKGMKSRHALPIVRRGLASAAQAGLLTRDRRREKASPRSSRIDPVTFGAVSPSQRRDRAGFSPASLFAGIRAVLLPLRAYNYVTCVAGQKSDRTVFTLQKFTIPDDKQLIVRPSTGKNNFRLSSQAKQESSPCRLSFSPQ